jgi:hypothetical protein
MRQCDWHVVSIVPIRGVKGQYCFVTLPLMPNVSTCTRADAVSHDLKCVISATQDVLCVASCRCLPPQCECPMASCRPAEVTQVVDFHHTPKSSIWSRWSDGRRGAFDGRYLFAKIRQAGTRTSFRDACQVPDHGYLHWPFAMQ